MATTTSGRKRPDWEAIERDYRTGRWTLRELETKHGVGYATIARKAKSKHWEKDLAEAVRQATSATLLRELTTTAQQEVNDVVLAAAEVNKSVILGHRKSLAALKQSAEDALATVAAMASSVADVKEAAVLVSAIESASRTLKNVIEGERKAFGIKDDDGGDDHRRKSLVIEFVEPGDILG